MSLTLQRKLMVNPDDRPAWLSWRRRGIGASDMPSVLGLSPYRTALDVYLDKIGERGDDEETEAMRIGKAAEPMLADLYEQRTGRTLAATQVPLESSETPYLICTLDGITSDQRLVEFKTAGGLKGADVGEEGSDELPRDWLVQAHHQMLVADAAVCDFAVLTGGFGFRFRVLTVERDPDWDEALHQAGADFWDRVLKRSPPPPVLPNDGRNLARLFRPDGSETRIDAVMAAEAYRWEGLGEQIKALQDERHEIEATLRRALATASVGNLPDGRRLKRYSQDVAAKTIEVKAHTRDYLQILKGVSS